MTEPALDLRPMEIGEILDRSFRLYRDNFLNFFAILLAVQGVIYVLQHLTLLAMSILARGASDQAAAVTGAVVASSVAVIVSLILIPLSQGALTLAVSERFLGRTASVREAYTRIMPRFMSLLAAGFFVWVMLLFGFLLLIIPGVYFFFAFLLTSVVVVVEGKKAAPAMSRSRELMRVKTQKGFFTFASNTAKASVITLIIFGFQCVIAVVAGGATLLATFMAHGGQIVAGSQLPWAAQTIVDGIVMLLQTTVAPFYTVAIILLYYDIRIRFEGFDLEMMAKSLSPEVPPEGAPSNA
jgi:hypothetical protein